MSRFASTFIAIIFVLACAGTAAQAQINSLPPPLQGEASFHLWSVPGVTDGGGLGAFFACTNTTGQAIRVGVEVFGPVGGAAANDPSATSLSVVAGGTVLFGTSNAAGFSVNSTLGAGAISNGSARVLATKGRGIICSAFLADPSVAPPTSLASLTVVKKTKQNGD